MIRLSCTTLLNSQHFSQFRHFRFSTFWFKHSPFSKSPVKCQNRPRLLIFHCTIPLPHKKFLFRKILMTSLHVICGLPSSPQSKILATPMTGIKRYVSNNSSMHHNQVSELLKNTNKQKTIEWFATLWNNSDSTSDWQSLLLSPLLSPLLFKQRSLCLYWQQ